MSQEQSRH